MVFTGGCGNLGKVMVKALLDYGANVAVPNRTDRFDASYDAYKAAGKAGVIRFTRTCASQLACRNIRVNSITPASNIEFIGRLSKKPMMKRTGKAEELNGAILLLASNASS